MVDRFPNYIHAIVTQSAADTFTTLAIPTPRPTVAGGTIVKELLWIDVDFQTTMNAAAEQSVAQLVQGSTPTALLTFEDSQVIAQISFDLKVVTTGGGPLIMPLRYNLQDAAGSGFLFAGETLHLSCDSTNTAVVNVIRAKLAYRDVRVTIEELNGLVISLLGG